MRCSQCDSQPRDIQEMLNMIRFLLILASALACSQAARILAFFPMPSTSHHNVYRPIIKELAARGHQVTYFAPIPMGEQIPNVTQVMTTFEGKGIQGQMDPRDFSKMSFMVMAIGAAWIGNYIGEATFGLKAVQELIHSNEHYDAVLMASLLLQEPVAAFMHKFNAVGVDIAPLGDSAWVNEMAGLPDNPSHMLDCKSIYTDDMSFLEKLHNTYITASTTLINYCSLFTAQRQMDKYFNYTGWESRPPLRQLLSDKALILVNSHISTGYAYPKAPNVKEIGGVNVVPNQPLPKDLDKFMNESKHGVIYFSIGSHLNISHISNKELRDSIIKTFSKVKQRVLWKWDSDILPTVSSNVKLSKWYPQQDILAHKNIKLFISHGGMLSIHESVYHGVPIVGIPFFGDQVKNVNHIVRNGYGIRLDFDNITETSMTWAINEILDNPSYAKEAKRRSEMSRNRPQTALEEAIYWIEYVIKYKNILQPKSAQFTFYQLHMLDIKLVFLLIIFLPIIIMYKLLGCLCRCCKRTTKSKTKKE